MFTKDLKPLRFADATAQSRGSGQLFLIGSHVAKVLKCNTQIAVGHGEGRVGFDGALEKVHGVLGISVVQLDVSSILYCSPFGYWIHL